MLLVLAALALPFVLGGGWFAYQIVGPSDPGRPVIVELREGWGASQIGDKLASEGVIDSSLAFQVWATASGAGPFIAGTYTLHEDEGIRGALRILGDGPPRKPDASLLLRPGLTLEQIAEKVGELPGHSKEEFLVAARSGEVRSQFQPAGNTSLEGMLFPDTYFIGSDESDISILRKLVSRFDEIAKKVGLDTATRVSPYETITVASLVETEAKLADDVAPIAAVVYNRLRDSMPLQIDSTLCYSKGGCPPVPNNADKEIDSPYNTYKNAGLPPTPIASVTEASLRAALAPADVPFKFYVLSDANGKHAFAATLAEHDRNVAAAREKGLL